MIHVLGWDSRSGCWDCEKSEPVGNLCERIDGLTAGMSDNPMSLIERNSGGHDGKQ